MKGIKRHHPLAKVAYDDWLSLKKKYGASIVYPDKQAQIETTSRENEPFRIAEADKFSEKVNNTVIENPPVFILGHWRSGTTFLQNLLVRDTRFGYLNVVQSLNPHTFLSREHIYRDEFQETKRFMDNVKLSWNAPSEEEVALGLVAPGSFWHGYYFADRFDYFFHTYTLFQGISEQELNKWKEAYLFLIKKLTLRYDHKPLLLKNPPNTGRIRVLLDLFPNAKFLHIHRNPFEVYESRIAQYETAVVFKALTAITKEQWEDQVFRYYKELIVQHFEQRKFISPENYYEISFHDLKANPIFTTRTIYTKLGLPDFSQVEGTFKKYLEGIASYEQNTYDFAPAVIEKVSKNWEFTLNHWNYAIPGYV